MTRSIPWPRILAEGGAIVLSILLAFGIQAWWDGVQEREAIRQDLVSVAAELTDNRDRVLFQLDLMQRMADGGTAMLEIMKLNEANRVADVPDTLVFLGTSSGPTLDASLGAVDALIASGRLALVDNVSLRRRLAGLGDLYDDVVESQVRAVALSDTQIRPATYEYLDNSAANQVAAAFWEIQVVGRELSHRTGVDFPNSMVLRGLLGFRNTLFVTTLPEMRALLEELEALLGLLRPLT